MHLDEYKLYGGRRRKHWIATPNSMLFSVCIIFNALDGLSFNSINYCITSESNCLYQFESYIERLSCINIFCSLWIENRLET